MLISSTCRDQLGGHLPYMWVCMCATGGDTVYEYSFYLWITCSVPLTTGTNPLSQLCQSEEPVLDSETRESCTESRDSGEFFRNGKVLSNMVSRDGIGSCAVEAPYVLGQECGCGDLWTPASSSNDDGVLDELLCGMNLASVTWGPSPFVLCERSWKDKEGFTSFTEETLLEEWVVWAKV